MQLGILASAFSPFLHPGHLWAIRQALDAGVCQGILAAVHADPSVFNKSKRQPPLTLAERVELVGSLRHVELVETYIDENELLDIMEYYRPVVRIIGEDHLLDYCTGDDSDPLIPRFIAKRNPEWSGTEFTRRIAESWRAST